MAYDPVNSPVVAGGASPSLIFTEDDVVEVADYSGVVTGYRSYVLRTGTGTPVALTECRLTLDVDGSLLIAQGTTDATGRVVFAHKLAPSTVVYVHATISSVAAVRRLEI
jgi:hypothetical protein